MTDPFTLVAPTASADGYGYSAEALALAAIRHHGADINLLEHDWQDSRYTDPEFLDLRIAEPDLQRRDVAVVYFIPYALSRYRARVTLSMTMWETDRLPDMWAGILDQMADGVIVPSEHCRQVFQERISTPVCAVPFGTDTRLFATRDRARTRVDCEHCEAAPYTFLMAGLLHYRKGAEFALRAFREEFQPGEKVRLILKTRRGFLDVGDETITLAADDRVRLLDEDCTREEMRDLYYAADCFLAPSRGEGSGLTPRDAMATGLPVILTDWGGLAELADSRYTYPVPIDGLEVAPEQNSSYGPGVTGGGLIGNFAHPSIPALRAAMRDCFENRAQARERGMRAAGWVRERWSWERCAGLWLQAIDELAAGRARVSA